MSGVERRREVIGINPSIRPRSKVLSNRFPTRACNCFCFLADLHSRALCRVGGQALLLRFTLHLGNNLPGTVLNRMPQALQLFANSRPLLAHQFSLDLRADLHGSGVRVTSIEPGMAETEFTIVRTGGDEEASRKLYAGMDPMTAEDIAETIWWVAKLPPHLNINALEIMPTNQSFAGFQVHREG